MVDDARDEVIGLTKSLVQLETVNYGTPDSGDEMIAAEFLRDKLSAEGIETAIYPSRENRGNFVAKLGGGDGPRLLIMSHTDVVPVENPESWTYPPFSGEIADGRLWGRGASDMKSTVASQAMAMLILKRAGVPINGTLTFATCADEEAGGKWGFQWLADNHPEVLRADYTVNEGGGRIPIKTDDGLIYQISTGEKGRFEIYISIKGKSSHAATPWLADNAIFKAQQVIDRLRSYVPETSIEADAFRHLDTLAGIDVEVTKENLEDVLQQIESKNRGLGNLLRAGSRMTLAVTMMNAGIKANSVAENCRITCDVRTLPSQSEADVRKMINSLIGDMEGVSFEIMESATSNSSPFDSDFRPFVEQATKDAVGRSDLRFVPGMSVGMTDSRFVRPLGNTTYGYIPSDPDDDAAKSGAHITNESVSLDTIMIQARFHVALAYRVLVEGK